MMLGGLAHCVADGSPLAHSAALLALWLVANAYLAHSVLSGVVWGGHVTDRADSAADVARWLDGPVLQLSTWVESFSAMFRQRLDPAHPPSSIGRSLVFATAMQIAPLLLLDTLAAAADDDMPVAEGNGRHGEGDAGSGAAAAVDRWVLARAALSCAAALWMLLG